MYAVIQSGGKQHRVTAGEQVKLEKLAGEVGDELTFTDVLMLSNDGAVTIGQPNVAGASVTGKILEQGRGKKIRVFTYKRRKNVRRRMGHRQAYTLVEITGIGG